MRYRFQVSSADKVGPEPTYSILSLTLGSGCAVLLTKGQLCYGVSTSQGLRFRPSVLMMRLCLQTCLIRFVGHPRHKPREDWRECHKYKVPLESLPACHVYRSGSDGEQGKVPLCKRTALCPTRMDQGAEGDGAGDDVAAGGAGRLLSPPLPSLCCIAFSNCLW
jgi:hypothetical protein